MGNIVLFEVNALDDVYMPGCDIPPSLHIIYIYIYIFPV